MRKSIRNVLSGRDAVEAVLALSLLIDIQVKSENVLKLHTTSMKTETNAYFELLTICFPPKLDSSCTAILCRSFRWPPSYFWLVIC
jgi:hypothetical protein